MATGTVKAAVRRLQLHHSRSGLPQQALQKLAVMSTGQNAGQENWCYACQQYTKRSAKFCGNCGQAVGAQYTHSFVAVPWRTQAWPADQSWDGQGTWSQHKKRRSQSPSVRKGKEKGKKGGKGAGKGADKGKGTGKQPVQLPDASTLPLAPVAPTLNPPSASTRSWEMPTAAQTRLDALVAALKTSGNTLPPDVLALLGEQEQEVATADAKEMHKLVNAQRDARREITRVRGARRSFLDSWASYTSHLADMLDKQIQEQDRSLKEFAELEQKWVQQYATATEALAKLSGGPQRVDSDSDMDKDEGPPIPDPWAADTALAQQQQKQKTLQLALHSAKITAEKSSQENKRDNSRTPRRARGETDAGDTKNEKLAEDSHKEGPQ